MMIGRYIVLYDRSKFEWRIYDSFRDRQLCYGFRTEKDARAWVIRLEEDEK